MLWVKKIKTSQLTAVALFIFLFVFTRVPGLDSDVINPDAVNWHYRSEQFVVGLKHGIYEKTFQHYHPGVTLMWLTGIPVEIFKQITGNEVYDQHTFYSFHLVAKLSLVIFQLVLSLAIIYWLKKIIGFKKAFFIVAFFSFEPFFLGNSRLFHLDIIFTLFAFASLITSYLYLKEEKMKWAFLGGIFAGLSFLTRSIGVGLILYVTFGMSFFLYLKYKNIRKTLKYLLVSVFSSIFTVFLLFPALWDKPIYVLSEIFKEGERVGVRNGHDQIFFGESTENAGIFFYPMVILLKFTPFLLIGIFLYKLDLFKKSLSMNKEVSFNFFVLLFYIVYFLVMTVPSKKLDRYMLTLLPGMSLMAVCGYYSLMERMPKKIYRIVVILGAVLFLGVPMIKFYPYYFTYYSPIFINAQKANSVIGQKPFGVGIFEVKEHILNNYGESARLGFIDTKPIKSIYPNSLVSDIRVNGASDYEVIVLAINEEMPENVLKSKVEFKKDSSIYLNGLEYWRFYVKQNN